MPLHRADQVADSTVASALSERPSCVLHHSPTNGAAGSCRGLDRAVSAGELIDFVSRVPITRPSGVFITRIVAVKPGDPTPTPTCFAMRSAGVADLLAIATVRRLLLEMGCDLQPGAETVLTTPLSFWIREPRSEWNGRTAVEIIGEPDGEALLRQCLLALIESRSAT